MRKLILALGCSAMILPTLLIPVSAADARDRREWRGRDGRVYCKKSNGTTGTIIGGVGGALLGRTVDTRGDRTVGTLGGAVLGGLAGRAIDKGTSNNGNNRRCR
ncbi:MAG TPA: glycine zipper 2TM domain-containing protein [Sphingomonas sp.]|nr:glycine zipper 2TM domain-containing protein [Sphingomonas sp.]